MTYYESIVLTLFDIVFYMLIAKKVLEIKRIFFWKDLIPLVILTLSIATFSVLIPEHYNFIISLVLFTVVFMIYFKISLFQSFILFVISTITLIFIQILSMVPSFIIFGNTDITFIHGIVSQSVGLVMVLLCYFFLPIHLIYRLTNRKNKVVKILLVNIFVLAVCILFYWYLDIKGLIENIISFVTISLLMVILNGVIIRNGLRNVQEQKQLEIYEEYLPVIDNLIDEIRKRQHDFNNHIQTIKSIQHAYDDLSVIRKKTETYSMELAEALEFKELLLLENKILAGFLYRKLQQAKEKGLSLQYDLRNVGYKLLDYELIEVISILLDNALEATFSGGNIQLALYYEEKNKVIKVANQSRTIQMDEFEDFFQKGYSTKGTKNRGYGLSRLSDIVRKYSGTIELTNVQKEKQQNYVVFLVSFP